MTLTSLGWDNNAASDVHLVPGLSSPEFFRLLLAFDEKGIGDHVFNLSGATVTFTPQLTGAPADHGLTVSDKTGEVTVKTAAMRGRCFILNVVVTQAGASANSRVRIHVHNAVQRIWPTPKRLTVRHGAKGVRFSVLALFDDGVIGDISNWSPFTTPGTDSDHIYVHATGSDTPALSWSPGGGPVTVDAKTGILTAPADTGESPITVKFGTLSGTATAACAKPWNTTVKLDLVSGPGAAQAGDIPNILFLPDGFQTEADRAQYERDVRLIVTRLQTRNRSRPYAALAGRVNYWRAWLPSPEPGVTVLNEVQPVPARRKGDVDQAEDVPLPSLTRPALGWSLPQLLNAVGLPNPTADHPGDPLAAKLAEWGTLYGSFTAAQVGRAYPQWLDISDRLLINERDTALQMAFSERPALAGDRGKLQEVTLNPRRVDPDDFNAFLDALRAGPSGDQVLGGGKLWTTGKDRDLVVVLCRSSHVGGVRDNRPVQGAKSGHTLGVSLARRRFHQVRRNADGNGFDLVPDTIPDDVFYSVWLTTAHELGHAFGLGDEYGGNADPPTAADITDSASQPNVQDSASAHTAGNLDTSKLKWQDWPRILKAGVLASKPVAAGGRLTVTLVSAKRSGLRLGDIVKFRRRPLVTAGKTSDVCQVLSVDLVSNQVIVNPLFGGSVNPDDFPAGSILFAFVREPDPDFAHNHFGGLLTLADPDILTHIAVTGNPLNAKPDDPEGRPDPNKDLAPPVAATNLTPELRAKSPTFSSWIVGAFENGHEHNSGFYHPTGTCVMNVNSKVDRTTKQLNLYDFCIVCRYAFVDAVDPTLHGQVEQDFREKYGKRGAQ